MIDRNVPRGDPRIEAMCKAFAEATGYYVEFHAGLRSASSDKFRIGMQAALEALTASPGGEGAVPFQERVQPWMMTCFGAEISADKLERGDRFLEEAIELLQAGNYPRERIYALIEYVYGRDQGDINQEVGGVMVTLAAYCLAHGLDMHVAGEIELERIWSKVEAIRAKQAAKPTGSALPVAAPHPPRQDGAREGLDWSGFKGLKRNPGWEPNDQDLVYDALNYLDGEGDADEDCAEQLIERLLLAWRRALATPPAPDEAVRVAWRYKIFCDDDAWLFSDDEKPRAFRCEPLYVTSPGKEMSQAAKDVLAERRRQVESEGWTSEHDDAHRSGEMARAAACYALNATDDGDGPEIRFVGAEIWPWADEWWKPSGDPRRDLVKAGALILAEIERLARSRSAAGGGV